MSLVRIYGKPHRDEPVVRGKVGIEDFTTQAGHPNVLTDSVSFETVEVYNGRDFVKAHLVTLADGRVVRLASRWIRRIGIVTIDEDLTVRWSE